MSNKLGLSQEEERNIKMVCEYLFFDQFTEVATFLRFERCFQPLFNEEPDLDLENLFKELCGPKKKYLNYKRFVNSFLKYKGNKSSKEIKRFFDKLFNSILENNSIGTFEEGRLTFSTRRANKNRECITLIEVLNDKEGVIHGINIEYDGIFKNKLYPKKLEDSLSVGLEISLKILDEEKLEKRGISKYIKASYFRDSVTHIFGTVNQETGYITFLGFKCVSGKTQFVGFPKGKSFLMGEFGKKFKQLKCQMTSDGITTLIPYFEKNQRPNLYLTKKISQLTLEDLSKDEIILDEAYLQKLKDKNEIDKFTSTTLIDDAHFFDFKLKDNIFGNSLKEVINKKPKRWMMQNTVKKTKNIPRPLSLNEFMIKFDEEQKRRGRFFREREIGFPDFDRRFHIMHRRKRLRNYGLEYEDFPYGEFPGELSRHLSPFGPHGRRFMPFEPMPPFMRPFSLPPHGPHVPHGPFDFFSPPPDREFGYFYPPHMGPPPMMDNYLNDWDYQRRYETYNNVYGNSIYSNNIMFRARPKQKDEVEQIKKLASISEIENNLIDKKQKGEKGVESNNIESEKQKKEDILNANDDEEVLVPDQHPEETTSLEELDDQLTSIKKLLEKKDLKEEEKKKLLKLEKLYSQQKNILIDNAEEKEKEEILKKTDIKLEEYIKKEEEKRQKESEIEEKLINKELEENADKTESKIISVITKPNPEKTFLKQEMYKGQEPWTDPLFKPCKENLCPCNEKGWLLPENVLFTDVVGWEKYNWCRVEEILNSKNYQVFEDGISPDDIIQGSIGDCYFLSAIGSLCKFSRYIDKLFFTKEKTKEHLYGVYIYLNGKWKLVFIDDYLPYSGKKFKKFAFSSSGGKELWVALLEKAWAKINGNYAKIGCGGSPTEVFDILTEAYSEQVPINPYYKDYIWETMYDAEKKGYIMTAGTSGDILNLNLDEVGLAAGHAYTVLGVMEIDTGKELEKVVRLRNPYGNGEFNGDWSDYSKKWTPELKIKYNLVIKDDGDFYMGFDDFIKYYITLGICKLHPGYKTTSVRIKHPTKCQVVKITIPKGEVQAYLNLYPKNPRVCLKDGTYQKLVYCYLLLVDKDFNYINSVFNANMHIGIEQTLKEGTYYLLSDVNYRYANKDKRNHSYMVTCYAQTPLNLENVTDQIDTTIAIQKAIYTYCRQYVPPNECSNGVYLYRISTNMDSIPFEAAVFENYTDKNYRVKVNVVGKGEKSFCFYHDEIANENDITAIKELPVNSVAIFPVLKYSLSSIFSLKYFFAPLKTPSVNTATSQKAPKIYEEKPTLQPEQPVDQNLTNFQDNLQNPQNQNIQTDLQIIPQQEQNIQNNQAYFQYPTDKEQNIQNNMQYLPYQDNNMNNNNQYIPYQNQIQTHNINDNKQYISYQENNININKQDIIPQTQNIKDNKQYINPQIQNVKDNKQNVPYQNQANNNNMNRLYADSKIQNNIKNNSNQPNNKPNILFIPQNNIQNEKNILNQNKEIKSLFIHLNNNQIIPKVNTQNNSQITPYSQNIKINKQYDSKTYINTTNPFIPKSNVKNSVQFVLNNNLLINPIYNIQSNIQKNTQCIGHNKNIHSMTYSHPDQKQTMQNNISYVPNNTCNQKEFNTCNQKEFNINKNIPNIQDTHLGNPVFRTQGQIINKEGTLVQYQMINGDNYIIGIENRSNIKMKLKLLLEGLIIICTGKSFATFYNHPKERKIFKCKILPYYNYNNIAFQFQYA